MSKPSGRDRDDPHVILLERPASAADAAVEVPDTADLDLGREITVEAVVDADEYRAEAMQPLVSKWRSLETFDTFDAYDAGHTDGLATVGHYGAVFDGRYVYFCPIRETADRKSVHGRVLRYDTHGDFGDSESYDAYDAEGTDGLRTVCYYGAAFDGRCVYFIPRDDGDGYHSRMLRHDTRGEFKSPASWAAYDFDLNHSHQSAAFDGRYIYCCPGYVGSPAAPLDESTFSGKVVRIDTQGGFKDAESYAVFDATVLSPEAANYDGGAFDGRYVYFVPLETGVVLRHDTRAPFADPGSWATFDGRPLGMGANVGAVFDGTYLYFCAYGHSSILRYDTRERFDDAASWERHDAARQGGVDRGGYDGGFFDGRFIYFAPYTRQARVGWDERTYHCDFLRYDTAASFSDPAAWRIHDAGHTDGLVTVGYNAGAFDGRFFYLAPLYDGQGDRFHGRILRYDTTGPNASFSLRYCDYGHNGGLCAAVPGPSFLVNTEGGVVSIAAHRGFDAGRHHLAGVYDGRAIKLFVDGVVVARREASGRIRASDVNVTIGGFPSGAARFRGKVELARVSSVARSDEWIADVWDGRTRSRP